MLEALRMTEEQQQVVREKLKVVAQAETLD